MATNGTLCIALFKK
ncbi:hypothetical protein CGLO_14209 [Colletotrichum gloeosporioides Cg-14]|uniref:Uncharacterized protein n=1 Tax=Colletotrichum gloeosporioides (strain Cg-14) TaxID=1237896 RepID=T0JUS1_COLGC|nr:hypothetical protein CGLO_14209 [Colletotrichum gloeosporioides Cg-14]